MNYYQHHLFFCTNQRQNGQNCCNQFNAKAMYRYAKDKCRNLGLLGKGKIGIAESSCLGRCKSGPIAVIYPEGIWYKYIDETDIDEIINKHLINHKVVARLLIK